jgi:hypothetical protein
VVADGCSGAVLIMCGRQALNERGLESRKCLKLDCNLKAVHGRGSAQVTPQALAHFTEFPTVFERVPGAPEPDCSSITPPGRCVLRARACLAGHRHHPRRSTSAREHSEPSARLDGHPRRAFVSARNFSVFASTRRNSQTTATVCSHKSAHAQQTLPNLISTTGRRRIYAVLRAIQ